MKWTHEAPCQECVGRFFWMKLGDHAPEVVYIDKWSGKQTQYVRVVPCTTADGQRVYCQTHNICYSESKAEIAKDIAAKTLWAGPIEAPEE